MMHGPINIRITKEFTQVMGDIIKGHAELRESERLYAHLNATKRCHIARSTYM